jgi:hypothetical protein
MGSSSSFPPLVTIFTVSTLRAVTSSRVPMEQ